MANIVFPPNPTIGQVFTTGGMSWIYDGTKWNPGTTGGAFLPISGGALTGPLSGPGNNGTIISANSPPTNDNSQALATTSWIQSILSTRQSRNRLINGDFGLDQYNDYNFIIPTVSAFVGDRWIHGITQTSKLSVCSVLYTPPAFPASMFNSVVAASYTPLASDYFDIEQAIEGFNVDDFSFGTSGAKSIVLSFSAASTRVGTYSGSIVDGGPVTRSYPFTFIISSPQIWTQYSIVIPGDTAGSNWGTTNNAGMRVRFDLGAGANWRAPAGAWTNGNFIGATGAIQFVAQPNGSVFWLTNVQLEIGTQATPFDKRPIGTELLLCRRYYTAGGNIPLRGYTMGAAPIGEYVFFNTNMRVTPTISATYTAQSVFNAQGVTVQYQSPIGFYVFTSAGITGTVQLDIIWSASAEL